MLKWLRRRRGGPIVADVLVLVWPWPKRVEAWGEGEYVLRDGDWVRP